MPREYDDAVDPLDDVDIREPVRKDVSQEDKQWATFAHLGGLLGGFVIPFAGWFLAPLIIWMIKKDTSRFVDDQGKEALNFQITMFIGELLAAAITAATCFIGFPVLFVPFIVGIIYAIQGTMAANRGEWYRYPTWTLRLIK